MGITEQLEPPIGFVLVILIPHFQFRIDQCFSNPATTFEQLR